jgi:hypothetical protein
MTTALEYRQFAADCGRWACAAKDAGQRDRFLSLTYVWEDAALRKDREAVHEIDKAALFSLVLNTRLIDF